MAEKLRRHKRVELELVAAAAHLGQYVEFHPMTATEGEQLPEGLKRSSVRILINTKAIRVCLDKEKISKEMDLLQKRVAIAYFIGGGLSAGAL